MVKTIKPVFCSILLFILLSCTKKEDLDSWLGDYSYSEEPIRAVAGYYMVMDWDLSIHRVNGTYVSILNVNGQQTGFSCDNKIKGNDSLLIVIFDKLNTGFENTLHKGDTLFTLSRKRLGIITKWYQLTPRLSEFVPAECECFTFKGTNANKNILETN